MKNQILLAGMLLSTAPAMAAARTSAPKVNAPDICESVANYAAQALNLEFQDGTFDDGKINPVSVRIHRDFKKFPVTDTKFLGNCDTDEKNLKESWCQVAGGSADVYQLEVSENDGVNNTFPSATVIVTYNRGGCRVDTAERE